MVPADSIIIDAIAPMSRFLKDTGIFNSGNEYWVESTENYLDELIDRVVECVTHEQQALSRLWDFFHEITNSRNVYDSEEDAYRIAHSAVVLGETLHDHLKMLGAYENQHLRYFYSGRFGRTDLILSRFIPGQGH